MCKAWNKTEAKQVKMGRRAFDQIRGQNYGGEDARSCKEVKTKLPPITWTTYPMLVTIHP